MRAKNLLSIVLLMGLLASTALAQNNADAEIELLRQRLEQLESRSAPDAVVIGRRQPIEIGSRPRSLEPENVVRVYDLGDLFVTAPHYQAHPLSDLQAKTAPLVAHTSAQTLTGVGGGGGGLGSGGGGYGGNDNRMTVDDLIEAIENTIEVDSWDPVGDGTIATLGTTLIISADQYVHEQVEALIAQLRQRWGTMRTVTVKARWLWLTDLELAELSNEQSEDGTVDTTAWRELLEHLNQAKDRPKSYQAAVTGYNGQTVHVVSGGQSLSVTGLESIVGAGSVGYEPIVSLIQEGAVLQVKPTASTSGNYVILDVHSRVNQLRKRGAGTKPGVAVTEATQVAGKAMEQTYPAHGIVIDRPMLMNYRLSTTLRVPVRKTVLVGGMTFESEAGAGERNLYLFVESSVQELKDRQMAAAP